ncbi:MAG: hypothetical protein E7609_03940 [Ruminococcaceae bacterium]|nr:hypothetical protein [Oscillospiraceae bacterium]
MKNIRILRALTLVALSMLLLLSLISCGDLKVESFTPVRASVKTSYLEGETVDFSGLKVQIQYNDSDLNTELTLDDGLVLEYDEDITATAGNKQVKITYECPHTGTTQEAILPILVEVDPDAVKHDSYVLDVTGMKTTYLLGETIDFTGIKVIEKFTNGGADVEMTDLSLISYTYDAATITAAVGNKQIAVTYNGEAAGAIAITVNYPTITSTVANLTGIKTEYLKGESASFTGLTFTLTYENGETRTVDTFTLVSNTEALLSTFGEKDVLVKFTDPISGTEQSASFKIKVDGIKDYTVDVTAAKTEYDAGEGLSFDGITVTANYYFGKTEAVTTGISFVYADDITNTAGNKQIGVTVNGVSAGSYTIAVGDIPTLVLGTDGMDLSYRVGDTVSLEGLTATVTYKDDATKNFTVLLSDLSYSLDGATAAAGTKKITVTYMLEGEIAITADVSLTVYGISGYDVETDGVKLGYIVGDTINLAGVKVYAKYDDGGERVLIDAARIRFDTDVSTATIGNKDIRVFLDGASAAIGKITIGVEKNTIEKIEILGDYETLFEKDKDILFTGMSLKVTYKNGSSVTVPFTKLTFTGADKSTLGKQNVTVSFTDEINNEQASTTFSIEVYEKKTVSQFKASDEIDEFKASNDKVGTVGYGGTGFESQYENKAVYLIGDDNEFTFYPLIRVGTTLETLTGGFYSDVTLAVKLNGSYKVLEARIADASKPSVVSYYDGDTLYATVNTYYGRYQFSEAATNKEVKLSVLPNATRYDISAINPVTLEAKVIDGYNVTEAWQLAVIDNTQSELWNTLKTEKGIVGIDPAAVILHKNIKIAANDIPSDLLLTLSKDIVYTNDTTKEEKTIKAGTKYVKDGVFVYVHSGEKDFAFEGNFFKLDLSEFPLVPSPTVFGEELGYGSDFSNMTLLYFQQSDTHWDAVPSKMTNIVLENFSLRGNAGADKWVDSQGNLVSAGGVIFMKAVDYTDVTVQNANITSCFIPFFSDLDGYLMLDTVKVYDSYQNALYIWGDRGCDVKNSYFIKAGGPMAIVQSLYRDEATKVSSLNIEDTVIETGLTGEEIWFAAIGATPIVSQKIQPLLYGLEQAGIGQFMDSEGKMNIISAIISDTGSGFEDLNAVISMGTMEGSVLVNGGGIERDLDKALWQSICGHPKFAQGAGFITVGTDSDAVVLYTDGNGFYAHDGTAFNPQGSMAHYEMYQKLVAADYFTLSQGGLSVTFGRIEK